MGEKGLASQVPQPAESAPIMAVMDSTPYNTYARQIVAKLLSADILGLFPECQRWLDEHAVDLDDWQIALPLISCLAAGGWLEDGMEIAAAWYSMYLASSILDHVEDGEFLPDVLVRSPAEAVNLGTGLIFLSYRCLSSIKALGGVVRSSAIFSDQGFGAASGQQHSLAMTGLKSPLPVNAALEQYWQTIILKSGSVFRAGTAGGAAAATQDEVIIEALGKYGTALGVMLQLLDDGRDLLKTSDEVIQAWEISLPLLLYLLATDQENVVFPAIHTRAEWHRCLREARVFETFSDILLQWKKLAVESIQSLGSTEEKKMLEKFPELILEPIKPEGYK